MASYQEHALDGASPLDLVVALYDGIIRFLYAAIAAAERDDVAARRMAVKRALAIVIHLQARLRMDIGGRPAEVLSEFYASIFALILQASTSNSPGRFEDAIRCVRELRDAWRQVAAQCNEHPPQAELSLAGSAPTLRPQPLPDAEQASRWTA